MDIDNAHFQTIVPGFETSDGVRLDQAISKGRHALVLLRHFG